MPRRPPLAVTVLAGSAAVSAALVSGPRPVAGKIPALPARDRAAGHKTPPYGTKHQASGGYRTWLGRSLPNYNPISPLI